MVPEVVMDLVSIYHNRIPLKTILEVLEVPSSTYHRWKTKKYSRCDLTCNEEAVIRLCKETKYLYGYRRITALLRREMQISHNTVQKIMQKHNLNCRVRVKRYRKLGQKSFVSDNLLQREFSASRPMEKLVTDITYLPFGPKVLYLSSIMDCFNGEIISYTISDKQDVPFDLDTLNQLPCIELPCTLHSDQGWQYQMQGYHKILKDKEVIQSMSRKGNCLDNSPTENFLGIMKKEMFIGREWTFKTLEKLEIAIEEYMEYYNNKRISLKLKGLTPVQYRNQSTI